MDVVGIHDPIIIGEYPDYDVASKVMIELFGSIPYCDTIRIPLLDEVEKFCSR